ncbi:MAG: hypothetical protein ACPIB6_10770, partial [Henriciella sp.]
TRLRAGVHQMRYTPKRLTGGQAPVRPPAACNRHRSDDNCKPNIIGTSNAPFLTGTAATD